MNTQDNTNKLNRFKQYLAEQWVFEDKKPILPEVVDLRKVQISVNGGEWQSILPTEYEKVKEIDGNVDLKVVMRSGDEDDLYKIQTRVIENVENISLIQGQFTAIGESEFLTTIDIFDEYCQARERHSQQMKFDKYSYGTSQNMDTGFYGNITEGEKPLLKINSLTDTMFAHQTYDNDTQRINIDEIEEGMMLTIRGPMSNVETGEQIDYIEPTVVENFDIECNAAWDLYIIDFEEQSVVYMDIHMSQSGGGDRQRVLEDAGELEEELMMYVIELIHERELEKQQEIKEPEEDWGIER